MKFRALAAVCAVVAGALCAACAGDPPEPDLTRRQKDSIIADLPIPGAGGVGRALDALDDSEARARAHDSLAAELR